MGASKDLQRTDFQQILAPIRAVILPSNAAMIVQSDLE